MLGGQKKAPDDLTRQVITTNNFLNKFFFLLLQNASGQREKYLPNRFVPWNQLPKCFANFINYSALEVV